MKIDSFSNIRDFFPIFNVKINGNRLSYLDNAAITQVPKCVIDSFNYYYSNINANIHRGAYYLSERATEQYENVRMSLNKFFNGENSNNFIFVKGTTEALNLVAYSFLRPILNSDDEVLISHMEHHSNIVPWYILCKEKKAKLIVIPILQDGTLDYSKLDSLLKPNTKILSITHVSNSLGIINNLKMIIKKAHSKGIPVLIAGAQSFSSGIINLKELDCDFYAFSSHKMYGPNGLGFLYAKKKFLDQMEPYQSGGDMIKSVSFSNVLWNDLPYKFEAGTPPIASVIAFGETIKFLNELNLDSLFVYKKKLFDYAYDKLSVVPFIKFLGNPVNNSSIMSFLIDGVHPHDFATVANHYGVAVRTGHHCSMPVMNFFNVGASVRVSLSFYNDYFDIDTLMISILEAKKIFS
jgi:cysteine desulfurase/selenocysteine lyase